MSRSVLFSQMTRADHRIMDNKREMPTVFLEDVSGHSVLYVDPVPFVTKIDQEYPLIKLYDVSYFVQENERRTERFDVCFLIENKHVQCVVETENVENYRNIYVEYVYDSHFRHQNVPSHIQSIMSSIFQEILSFIQEKGFRRLDLLTHEYTVHSPFEWINLEV